ncbi:MAG: isochorismatase family protein [Mycoplasmoidaceae bacterium]
MKAILIIDMQNDFSDFGTLPLKKSIELANRIFNLISSLNKNEFKVIASLDYHPINHISFNRFPVHCVARTKGAELIEPLNNFEYDLIVKKGTKKRFENFSCFYNGKKESKLRKYLNKNNIKDIYVCGIALDVCVEATIRDLIKNNYNTYLLEDLAIPLDPTFILDLDKLNKINSSKI